jgi:hypothetical protein
MSWAAEESEMEYSEAMEEYGEETATFQGYYKNFFTYEAENLTILAEHGYRVEFEPEMKVGEIPNIYEIKRGENTIWRAVRV